MSRQLDQYIRARSAGQDSAAACALSGIAEAEARFIESDIAKGVITLAAAPDHNQTKESPVTQSVAADELRLLIERWERLDEERKAIADDQKDVMAEAKSRGYDTKTIRAVIRLRKMETHVRQEAEALLDTYKAALGMDYSSTPLGQATVERAAKAAAPRATIEVNGNSPIAREIGKQAEAAGFDVVTR